MKRDEKIVQEGGGVGEGDNKHRIGGFSQREAGDIWLSVQGQITQQVVSLRSDTNCPMA
jgi:hypothetical protein